MCSTIPCFNWKNDRSGKIIAKTTKVDCGNDKLQAYFASSIAVWFVCNDEKKSERKKKFKIKKKKNVYLKL